MTVVCLIYTDHENGRRPVGRPRKTWLESVEADIAELEIDKEDVGSSDSSLHVVELPRGRSFFWQIGVISSIQDLRQVDRGFLWSRVSRARQR